MYNNNHHLSNIRFVNETVQQIANYKGTELLYVGLDISISQDYVISNYDNPKHYNVTMETGFGVRPDFVEWTKATYLQNGEFYAKAISEYIHGLSNANDILIDNTNATQVNLSGNWSSGNILLGYFGTDYISAPSGTPSSATFSATIPTAGKYEIFTRWVSSPNFESNAPATFTYSGGTDSFSLNMTSRGGNWISLGNYDLAASE